MEGPPRQAAPGPGARGEAQGGSQIAAGDDWRGEIEEALATADAAVLLVTADFLTEGDVRYLEERLAVI